MSQTTKELYTRVVAVAVQSLMNRYPKRPLGALSPNYYIHLSAWDYSGSLMGLDFSITGYPQTGIEALSFVPKVNGGLEELAGEYEEYVWITGQPRSNGRRARLTQGEAEKMYSTAFTFPYPVTRVSDEALKLAQDLVEINVPYAFP